MARSPYIIAGVAVLALGGWLASGMLAEEEPAETAAPARAEPQAPLVEVAASAARPVTRSVIAQGDVLAFRSAPARTQTDGRVNEILVSQGERVEQGEPLVRLTLEGRGSRLREARAVLDQRQQDYEAAATLLEQGYTTASNVRELRTALERAREEVERLEEEVGDTTVTAPFAGVVDSLDVAVGEYLTANSDVATLIDNSPLRTMVRVNQNDIARVETGREALVSYATGQEEAGRVCFVSASADPRTRTFRVEIRTPNAGDVIPSGISAEARIPTEQITAHFVSPAILSLGTDGSLGVKTVGEDQTVAFHAVEVVRAQTNGVWVSGLPEEAAIVTIGQGFVQAGDRVRISEAEESEFAGADNAEPRPAIAGVVPEDICERDPVDVPSGGVAAVAGDGAETAATASVAAGTPAGGADAAAADEQASARAAEDREGATFETGAALADTPLVQPGTRPAAPGPDTVADVQRALNELGFEAGEVDGVGGAQTRQAVRSFQEAHGLPATGELDAATIEEVTSLAAGAPVGEDS